MHLLIMGAPGSGKGTCAVELKNHYSIPHISTGDIFRKAISDKTTTGLLAQSYIDKGQLVPDEITNQIVKERLSEKDCQKGFLLDGFPRNLEQAKALSNILNELNIKLDAAINLEIEDKIVEERIVNRRICSKCGRGYNIISLKPKIEGICDVCGGSLYQRKDDAKETIEERLHIYNNQTKPIITYYNELGILVSVNSNQTPQKVIEDIINQVNSNDNI